MKLLIITWLGPPGRGPDEVENVVEVGVPLMVGSHGDDPDHFNDVTRNALEDALKKTIRWGGHVELRWVNDDEENRPFPTTEETP